MSKIRLQISPYYLIRNTRKNDIKKLLKEYKFSGSLLDIGCGSKPYKYLFHDIKSYQGIDFADFSVNKDFQGDKPDYHFSDTYTESFDIDLPSQKFDNIVSFQVLEHHANPQKFVSEISRLLKPDGKLLLSWPFLGGLHEKPHDYSRLTEFYIKNLLAEHDLVIDIIKKEGSTAGTIAMLLNEELNAVASKGRLFYWLTVTVYPIFFVNMRIAQMLDKIYQSENIFYNYILVAHKKTNK